MYKLLITLDDIREFYPVSKNIDNARLLPYVRAAQDSDLKPLLGQELFFDFITNNSSANNEALYNGGSYAYQGRQVFFSGVRQLLCSWAYSRLYDNNSNHVTRGGNVQKETEESTPNEAPNIFTKSTEAKSDAIRIQSEISVYLDQNRSLFPLYGVQGQLDRPQRTAFRIGKVPARSTAQSRSLGEGYGSY